MFPLENFKNCRLFASPKSFQHVEMLKRRKKSFFVDFVAGSQASFDDTRRRQRKKYLFGPERKIFVDITL